MSFTPVIFLPGAAMADGGGIFDFRLLLIELSFTLKAVARCSLE